MQCTGVSFNASLLPAVASSCTGPFLDQSACCSAVNALWQDAAIASPQAAQTLGVASLEVPTEQACLNATQQALAPLGVTIDLSQLCSGPLTYAIASGNTCPSQSLPPTTVQKIISACQNVNKPNDVCGPCNDAVVSAIGSLLPSTANAAAVSPSGAVLAAGASLRTIAVDCASVVLASILQQDPGFYRVEALTAQAFNGTGCASTSSSTVITSTGGGP